MAGAGQSRLQCQPLTIDDVKDFTCAAARCSAPPAPIPTKSAKDMDNVLDVLRDLNIDALVTIGGDDTAYSAQSGVQERRRQDPVAHVPKTIDNDLPLPGSTPTFGFETARQLGVCIVRNLAEDARTTSRWYLIISMGRAAGHLALGIGKAAAATLTVIPEEFRGTPVTLDDLCDIIIGSIIKRKVENTEYGVVVLAEGLIESIGEKALVEAMDQIQLGRYGSGDARSSTTTCGSAKSSLAGWSAIVSWTASSRSASRRPSSTRTWATSCAAPTRSRSMRNTPATWATGRSSSCARRAARSYGAIISYVEGRMNPLPFEKMINPETKRLTNRKVNVDGEGYESARRYMTRLEKKDFKDPHMLAKLATMVKMTTGEFQGRFEHLLAHEPRDF